MSDLKVGDEVVIWGDAEDGGNLKGIVREVDLQTRKVLIEFTNREEDGETEWWPMDNFDELGEIK